MTFSKGGISALELQRQMDAVLNIICVILPRYDYHNPKLQIAKISEPQLAGLQACAHSSGHNSRDSVVAHQVFQEFGFRQLEGLLYRRQQLAHAGKSE